jgi:hypothetical protein
MSQLRSARGLIFLFSFITFATFISGDTAAQTTMATADGRPPSSRQVSENLPEAPAADVQATVSAANSTVSWDSRDPGRQRFELPLLYLHHGRETTDEGQRTLELTLSGVTGGTEILIEVRSHHADVITSKRYVSAISLVAPDPGCTTGEPCTVEWPLGELPSDFYTLRVRDANGAILWENAHPARPDFVALDAWDVDLGAYAARVTYATLFPFARDRHDLDRRLASNEVVDFIENQFVPIIQETWHTQVEEWGFGPSLHPDWDSDNVVEIVITAPPFALFDGTGTYTVFHDAQGHPYPQRRIWWLPTLDAFPNYYATLADHYRITFAHEFFHLMQWNVLLTEGQTDSLGGSLLVGKPSAWRAENYWQNAFIESQGRFISSAQYPELELRRYHLLGAKSPYVGLGADRYLKEQTNVSYRDMETEPGSKYDLALYWRFLYERYGDMRVVRAALKQMVRHYDADILDTLETVMDATFDRLDGPFRSYQESLIAFARANYALRLENGRCVAAVPARCDGVYFDPDQMYAKPPLAAELVFAGQKVTYGGAIPASYGMDFLEVRLHPGLDGRPLQLRFQVEGPVAHFSVQMWKIGPGTGLGLPYALTPAPDVVPLDRTRGAHVYTIPAVDRQAYGRLALIITRLDAAEQVDPAGAYQLTLE